MVHFFRWLIPLAPLFCSCEKAISFVPDATVPELVVEAVIENGQPPVVILSRSLNFTSQISPEALVGAFVRNAVISISNGSRTHTLKEYEEAIAGYSVYYYSVDSSDTASAFSGELGGHYTMTIQADGKQYAAATTIPAPSKRIDALSWEYGDEEDSTKAVLLAQFYDPPGLGNYIRYFTSINGGPYLPAYNSVYDDHITDGKTYSLQLEQGVDRNSEIDFEENSFFAIGDRVVVKLCNIDKQVFDFWRTMEYSYSSIGNPFSSPTKVMGNIKGGALGYFGGYAVQYSSIIIE